MNMELWAATFLRFAALLHFIFLPFSQDDPFQQWRRLQLDLLFQLQWLISGCLSHQDSLGRCGLCRNANCNWIITFKNCRNAVEHSKMAGHILDFDIGLSQASLFDVNAGSQSTLLSTIFDIFFSLFLFHLAALIISLPRF